MHYILFVCSLLARPALGTATTVDIRCLSSRRDARTCVHTKPSPVVVDIRCLSSLRININRDYFNITIIFSIFAYNKVGGYPTGGILRLGHEKRELKQIVNNLIINQFTMRTKIPRESLPTMMRCRKCGKLLPAEQFELYSSGTRRHVCNKCKYLHYTLPAHYRWCMRG